MPCMYLHLQIDFDEINIIETQVAEIANISKELTEKIDIQAEIADNVHENVTSADVLTEFNFLLSRCNKRTKMCATEMRKF